MNQTDPIHGRGAAGNPGNRFELLMYEEDPCRLDPDAPGPATQLYKDRTRSLLTYNDSPDVGFNASINPYRGCEHGCIYCYARPYHEYVGLSIGLDFETKILVKEDAPALLRKELASTKWQPQTVGVSGVTDCYQPIERKLQITRRCLEVFAEFRNPVVIVTKSQLVTRDIDVLKELAEHQAAAVFLSVTTLDDHLAGVMEPRATRPAGRLDAIAQLTQAGIPVGTLVSPIILGLNDHEIPAILQAAADAGAKYAGYIMLRLPYGVANLFQTWLEQHFPDRKEKILSRIRDLRGGKLNEARFGSRMKGEGIWSDVVKNLFEVGKRQAGIVGRGPKLSTEAFRRTGQRCLFD